MIYRFYKSNITSFLRFAACALLKKRRTLSAATVITSKSFTMDAARTFRDAFEANDTKKMKSSLQNLNVQVGAAQLALQTRARTREKGGRGAGKSRVRRLRLCAKLLPAACVFRRAEESEEGQAGSRVRAERLKDGPSKEGSPRLGGNPR